jgi:hypothetical protein
MVRHRMGAPRWARGLRVARARADAPGSRGAPRRRHWTGPSCWLAGRSGWWLERRWRSRGFALRAAGVRMGGRARGHTHIRRAAPRACAAADVRAGRSSRFVAPQPLGLLPCLRTCTPPARLLAPPAGRGQLSTTAFITHAAAWLAGRLAGRASRRCSQACPGCTGRRQLHRRPRRGHLRAGHQVWIGGRRCRSIKLPHGVCRVCRHQPTPPTPPAPPPPSKQCTSPRPAPPHEVPQPQRTSSAGGRRAAERQWPQQQGPSSRAPAAPPQCRHSRLPPSCHARASSRACSAAGTAA